MTHPVLGHFQVGSFRVLGFGFRFRVLGLGFRVTVIGVIGAL